MDKETLKEKLLREDGQLNLLAKKGKVVHIQDDTIPFSSSLCGTPLIDADKNFIFGLLKNPDLKRCTKCEVIYLNRIR